jgi:hypothetical protein
MITRMWHGWTAPENAASYERFLLEELFPAVLEPPALELLSRYEERAEHYDTSAP